MTPTAPAGLLTAEEFMAFVERPENAGRWFELDRGRVIEMPPPGRPHGVLCSWIAHLLWQYAIRVGGQVTSNDTAFVVGRRPDCVRGADVMLFLTACRLADIPPGPVTDLPALIAEVYSPSDRPGQLNRRVSQYLRRGVPLVWVVYPDDRSVDVYRPGAEVLSLDGDDALAFPDVLPGFAGTVRDLFALPGADPAS
jgi:Uma2 family endonuclease